MGKVVGVGGVFLGLQGQDQELRDWYETHLKLDMSPYGTGFINGDQLMLVSFTRHDANAPLINFRVDNIEEIIAHLMEIGCEVKSPITEYPYGKFAQFQDPFHNCIELWEPNVEEYRKMVQNEITSYQKKKSN